MRVCCMPPPSPAGIEANGFCDKRGHGIDSKWLTGKILSRRHLRKSNRGRLSPLIQNSNSEGYSGPKDSRDIFGPVNGLERNRDVEGLTAMWHQGGLSRESGVKEEAATAAFVSPCLTVISRICLSAFVAWPSPCAEAILNHR